MVQRDHDQGRNALRATAEQMVPVRMQQLAQAGAGLLGWYKHALHAQNHADFTGLNLRATINNLPRIDAFLPQEENAYSNTLVFLGNDVILRGMAIGIQNSGYMAVLSRFLGDNPEHPRLETQLFINFAMGDMRDEQLSQLQQQSQEQQVMGLIARAASAVQTLGFANIAALQHASAAEIATRIISPRAITAESIIEELSATTSPETIVRLNSDQRTEILESLRFLVDTITSRRLNGRKMSDINIELHSIMRHADTPAGHFSSGREGADTHWREFATIFDRMRAGNGQRISDRILLTRTEIIAGIELRYQNTQQRLLAHDTLTDIPDDQIGNRALLRRGFIPEHDVDNPARELLLNVLAVNANAIARLRGKRFAEAYDYGIASQIIAESLGYTSRRDLAAGLGRGEVIRDHVLLEMVDGGIPLDPLVETHRN